MLSSNFSSDSQCIQVASLLFVSNTMKFGSGGRIVDRRNLAAVKAPRLSDSLGKMVLGALCEMNVSAQCPGGLLSRND